MGREGTSDTYESMALDVVETIGTAWTTFALYPDPSQQPAFTRAVLALSEPFSTPLIVGVGPGRFTVGEETLPLRREGSERIARELFLHDVEHLKIVGGATLEGLIGFFRAIALADDHVRELGGIRAVLREVPATGIEVLQRGLLVLTSDGGSRDAALLTENMSSAAAAAFRGADPDEIAELLMAEDAAFSAETYFSGLWGLHEQAEPLAEEAFVGAPLHEGAHDPWREFRAFLESFFFLRRDLQLGVLEAVLTETTDDHHRLFLDQLTETELTEFLPDLSEAGVDSLRFYAADVAAETGRPVSPLLGGLVDDDMLPTQQAVSKRIADVLSSVDRDRSGHEYLLATLRDEMTQPWEGAVLTGDIVRGLLECESRDDRFSRVVRIWTGRVTKHLRTSDLDSAQALLDKVMVDPPFSKERAGQVREGLDRLGRPDVMKYILDAEVGDELSERASQFLVAIGTSATDALVAMLAEATEQSARRSITSLLVPVVTQDPLCLDNYLLDERWYLLRNLATVLGKTGRMTAVAAVRRLLKHDDQRVRAEALRSLIRLQRGEAGPTVLRMLSDPHPLVQEAAASLAANLDSPAFDTGLVRELESGKYDLEVLIKMVALLGARRTPTAQTALERLGARRLVLRKRDRELRATARRVIAGRAA